MVNIAEKETLYKRTAFGKAGEGIADEASLKNAIEIAVTLARNKFKSMLLDLVLSKPCCVSVKKKCAFLTTDT